MFVDYYVDLHIAGPFHEQAFSLVLLVYVFLIPSTSALSVFRQNIFCHIA